MRNNFVLVLVAIFIMPVSFFIMYQLDNHGKHGTSTIISWVSLCIWIVILIYLLWKYLYKNTKN